MSKTLSDDIQRIVGMLKPHDGLHRPVRIAVTGGVHAGKTTYLQAIAEQLTGAGFDVGGVIEMAVFEGAERIGYEFVDVKSGERCRVAVKNLTGCGYAFDEEAWGWAADRFNRAADVMVVDELGRLEAAGDGLMPCLKDALERRHLIAAVRQDVMERIERHLGAFDLIIRVDNLK
ncbi:MAG: DUF2478 domain-containing protein [Proteobacteria bacterium]|nr:DUF2478 domain-containing protein [Pseudomonadota bacterium]